MNQQSTTSPLTAAAPASPWQPDAVVRRRMGLAGLRLTQSRLVVLRALHDNSARFLEVESLQRAIQERGVTVPLPSIYRILVDMEKARLVQSTRQGARVLYRQVFEEVTAQPHFVCAHCGLAQPLGDAALLSKLIRCAEQQGFRMGPRIALTGVCAACKDEPIAHK